MRNGLVIILLVLVSISFSTYYPLDDARDGCYEYVNEEANPIVGHPDSSERNKEVFEYEFGFFIPQTNAAKDDLKIEIKRAGGFEALAYCTGQGAVISKINGLRASSDSSQEYLTLFPEEELVTGENSFYLANYSEALYSCSVGKCLSKRPLDAGICTFKVCGFYPRLRISSTNPPPSLEKWEDLSLGITIVNEDEVDAGVIKVSIEESDFLINPARTEENILSENEAPFNEFSYRPKFTPKKYTELETGASEVFKRLGKVFVSYIDVNGNVRIYSKDLGAISVVNPNKSDDNAHPDIEPSKRMTVNSDTVEGSIQPREDSGLARDTPKREGNAMGNLCIPEIAGILFLCGGIIVKGYQNRN